VVERTGSQFSETRYGGNPGWYRAESMCIGRRSAVVDLAVDGSFVVHCDRHRSTGDVGHLDGADGWGCLIAAGILGIGGGGSVTSIRGGHRWRGLY